MEEVLVIRLVREHLEAQFPRTCGGCGREYGTLRDYLLSTRYVGDPIAADLEAGPAGAVAADDAEVGSVMSMALCGCGTTMALDSEGMSGRTRRVLARHVRAETRRRGVSFRRVLRELRASIDAQVLAEAAPTDGAAPAPVEHGALLFARTIARVTDHLRAVVTLGLGLLTLALLYFVVTGAVTAGGFVVWGLLAVLTAVLWALRRRPRLAAGVAIVGMEGVLVATLAAFGPMAGAGVLVAVMVLVTGIHFGRMASVVVAIQATGVFVVVGALAVRHGWSETAAPFAVWVRTGVITGNIAAFIGLATSSLLAGLRRALADLERSRRLNERVQADLARRRELETAGRLVSGVVHDVNNSLTVVTCCVDELRRAPLTPAALELVGDIEATARAAGGTMRAMLDFVRPSRDQAARCDPAKAIGEVARNLQRLLPDDVTLRTALVEGHTVPMARGALLQATVNLVLNARDALQDDQPKQITIAVEPADGAVVIAVRDTGRGMDAATVARLGEPFFSTKGAAGTGLGVSMVRATVEGCGGRVVVESAPGRGTEVRLVLPAVAASAEVTAPSGADRLPGRRVLLVEDDDVIRRAFARGLAAAGATVTEAASVAQAVAAIGATAACFDLLVCDGILRDGTVAGVLVPFRRHCPQAPVILCTAHSPEVFTARGLALADVNLVAKPLSGAQLARAAAQALRV